MKKSLYISLVAFCLSSFADPAVKHVQVNIHNESAHIIKLQRFEATRIYESVTVTAAEVVPFSAMSDVITFNAFDTHPMTVHIPVIINDEAMTFMWQTNMGYAAPDEYKFHLCGVIKDGVLLPQNAYCLMPYVQGDTMYLDYIIQ